MEEIWKTCIDYDNYEVSNLGRVRNIEKHRIKKTRIDKNNYERVKLYNQNGGKVILVHTLVARAFIPGDHGRKMLVHKDGNTTNNRLDNLCYMNRGDGMKWQFDIGQRRSHSTKTRKVRCLETGKVYNSIHECARDVGLNISSVYRNMKTIKSTPHTKLHFEYAD